LRTRRIHSKYSSKDNILGENNTAGSLFKIKKEITKIFIIIEKYRLVGTSAGHPGPSPAQSRASFKIRPGFSEPQPIKI